jgi:hypothetical protein
MFPATGTQLTFTAAGVAPFAVAALAAYLAVAIGTPVGARFAPPLGRCCSYLTARALTLEVAFGAAAKVSVRDSPTTPTRTIRR